VECEFTACNPESGPCVLEDQASIDALKSCADKALGPNCGCSSFGVLAVSCLNAIVGAPQNHPAVAICGLDESSFKPLYTKVATFLCGPP